MLATVIGAVRVAPVRSDVLGFDRETPGNVTWVLKGMFEPALYMSLP